MNVRQLLTPMANGRILRELDLACPDFPRTQQATVRSPRFDTTADLTNGVSMGQIRSTPLTSTKQKLKEHPGAAFGHRRFGADVIR